MSLFLDHFDLPPCVCVYVYVCETNEAWQRDSCQNDQGVHQSCRCVNATPHSNTHFPFPPADAKLSLLLSVLPPSLQLLALHPLLCARPPTPSFLPAFYSSSPSLPLFSSSPDVLVLSSRLPCSFLSLLPSALSVSLSRVDFLTYGGPVTALCDPPPSFGSLSLSLCPPYKPRR